ncbi:hypothetical protein CCY99_01180 [Helicobacter sp. 16-1353]|uniref:divergent polysaccharide deacetylase family protein n=1 Tax=Helicobacter sp. 16-1353 TaxID=2004996 RepID=UPI000DCE954D|nr:divergent polysaccharide deacetylase family protein [Helicobacter sp. 16-1353]RAX55339.1 hypothetical protein CCY99_01180 [Helicobacter sp. 16-1353]
MKKLHNFMILSLILAIFSILVDLGTTRDVPTPKADNILHLSNNTNKIKEIDREIEYLEEQNDKVSTYTKQYKKRVDYDKNPTSSEIQDYKDNIIEEVVTEKKPKYNKILKDSKPKIVIIIDDIANKKQLEEIKKIDLKLTPSIFPISKNDKDMLKMVNELDFFMIHLPLEAKKYTDELDTIKVNDPDIKIQTKIENIKKTTPTIKYINNHTGSKFTANKDEMERLLNILDSHNIIFIDSRTTPDSKLNEIAKEQNRLILYRDIFIDNNLDSHSLNNQLQEGVNLAKQRGYAILIAHPHKETLRALKQAKDSILKDVDIIYIDELNNILQDAKVTQYAQRIHK